MARISVFITNLGRYVSGQLVGEYVKLPITEDELQNVLARIGIDSQFEEFFISDYESIFTNLEINEYASLEELNELADRVEELADSDCNKFGAVLEYEFVTSIRDVLELLDRLDEFDLLEGVDTDEDVGYYYAAMCGTLSVIPDHLQSYFDYEAYGRDIRMEANCLFTSYGLVMDNR